MASPLRFGLELEMHATSLTFRERGTGNYWSDADNMDGITAETLLSPLQPHAGQGFFLNLVDRKIKWESDWGFRAVGDAVGNRAFIPNGPDVRSCILELSTAAGRVDDFHYWRASRWCAEAFIQTIDHFSQARPVNAHAVPPGAQVQWYPLQTFLDEYNGRVDALPAQAGFIKARFKLAKARTVRDLESGIHPSCLHRRWDPFIRCLGNDSRWCDVQVNYQMSLRWLYGNIDAWISLWNSMWVRRIGQTFLDPQVGERRGGDETELYRVQTYAAMWRMAKYQVDRKFDLPATAGNATALVKGLMIYVLVASSISPPFGPSITTPKNRYSQLPKSSPASIARLIRGLPGAEGLAAAAYLDRLANVGGREVITAYDISHETLRKRAKLKKAPGSLPAKVPFPGAARFTDQDGGLLREPGPPQVNFRNTWDGAFNGANVLTDANNMGFITGAPFYVPWAEEVLTSYPAAMHGQDDIKILFESRYGRSKLNIGFNPYVHNYMFHRSYMALVHVLAGYWRMVQLQNMVNTTFPDQPAVQQNFMYGPH